MAEVPKVFQFLDSILQSGKKIDDLDGYLPFLVARGVSLHIDPILWLAELAQYPDIDPQMHYDFLFGIVRKQKRRNSGKWPKRIEDDTVKLLQQYYKCRYDVAEKYLKILTKEQLKAIKAEMEIGG